MKRYVVIVFAIFFSVRLTAQSTVSLQVNWEKEEVIINKIAISVHSSLLDIRKALGNESRVLSTEEKTTRLYIYDHLGLNFIIDTVANKLDKLDICWSPPRREFETSPKNLFAGQFSINDQPVIVTDPIADIRSKTGIAFEKMGLFYWYTADHGEFSVTFTYTSKKEERIGTIYILFRNAEDN